MYKSDRNKSTYHKEQKNKNTRRHLSLGPALRCVWWRFLCFIHRFNIIIACKLNTWILHVGWVKQPGWELLDLIVFSNTSSPKTWPSFGNSCQSWSTEWENFVGKLLVKSSVTIDESFIIAYIFGECNVDMFRYWNSNESSELCYFQHRDFSYYLLSLILVP